MARRTLHDPLQPVAATRWLVVRDELGTLLVATELPPGTDLRMALAAARDAQQAAGWTADLEPLKWSFFFCRRGQARRGVAIEVINPTGPPPLGHSGPERDESDAGIH